MNVRSFLRSRTAVVAATAATAFALGAGGVASAADDATTAASSLVLGLIPVENNPGQPSSVTLECDPVGGTHPTPKEACAALTEVGGDFAKLPNVSGVPACPTTYAPVEAVAEGTWNGTPVSYKEIFTNTCFAAIGTNNVFKF
ncbi:SSI family serine proteinase inhibitor [Streptomyces odontomachi]|uniref:SSI family serine proteinase inhibitor n=1 Tax=Streptomyces odontomachi TaxID=2944940 RepID=UPI00210B912D|nr:SSI family serine proteinase inhibitor [Streptomyces sp. ODS25]